MSDKSYNKLRDFLNQTESSDIYFAYSAMLRIFGHNVPLSEITKTLQIEPTMLHRTGEMHGTIKPQPWKQDMWAYQPAINETKKLHFHIDALYKSVNAHMEYLKKLKNQFTVDVFCGYRTNCDMCGINVPPQSLRIFNELEIPFGLSIIVTDD